MSKMIIGVGTDIISIPRFRNAVNRHQDHILKFIFTDNEIAQTQEKKNKIFHFAGKFAAKESTLKAFGMGIGAGISLRDIEIINADSGKPEVKLHRKGASIAKERDVRNIHITISHEKTHAVAFVILEN